MREEGKDVKMGFGILMLLCCELSKVIPGAYFTIHGVNGNVSLGFWWHRHRCRQSEWVSGWVREWVRETFFWT